MSLPPGLVRGGLGGATPVTRLGTTAQFFLSYTGKHRGIQFRDPAKTLECCLDFSTTDPNDLHSSAGYVLFPDSGLDRLTTYD